MDSYNIFICTAPGNWQLIGNSPARFMAQQIAEKICRRQSFAEQQLLAVMVIGAAELAEQAFIYKPSWNNPIYGVSKLARRRPARGMNLHLS